MLRASYYYFRKGSVCYILTFYSQCFYSELSICSYVFNRGIQLLWFICFYYTLIYNKYIIFIMFYFKLLRNFVFPNFFEYVPFKHICKLQKRNHNPPVFDHRQQSVTTERQSPIGYRIIVVKDIVNLI